MLFNYNLHPPLAHLPLALLFVLAGLQALLLFKDYAPLRSALEVNLVLAGLLSLAAFFSGYQGSEFANASFEISDDLISPHHQSGKLLLFIFLPSVLLYFAARGAKQGQRIFQSLYLLGLVLSLGLACYTGYLGGELVFKHGAGVGANIEQNAFKSEAPEW